MRNSNERLLDILDVLAKIAVTLAVIAGVVAIGSILNNAGYKDGYCSALGGSTIGNARVCNVDGQVVEIPSP